jgi:predicted Zn-dependent protease
LFGDSCYQKAYCDGAIVIGQWMRDMCESEDELAAIVAHEKAHLILKHGEKAWYEKFGGWVSSWFVDESKPRFRGPPDPKSVKRENEADEMGLMLMAEAGYDPQAAVDFWTRYYERTGWWEGDGTHPKPRERLAHLNALMPKAKELYMVTKNKKQKESAK